MKILVTGDDGYLATGTQLLAHILKDEHEVTVVATKDQASATGGTIDIFSEKKWGKDDSFDFPAYWVEGTPGDSMEFAQSLFPEGVDLIISGINWGDNIGLGAFTTSGTVGAAIRGIAIGIAKKAICVSWKRNSDDWNSKNNKGDYTDFLEHPGEAAKIAIDETIKNNLWDKQIVNINIPSKPTKEYKMTKLLDSLTKLFKYPVEVDSTKMTYKYGEQVFVDEPYMDIKYDLGAINSGYISISPISID